MGITSLIGVLKTYPQKICPLFYGLHVIITYVGSICRELLKNQAMGMTPYMKGYAPHIEIGPNKNRFF